MTFYLVSNQLIFNRSLTSMCVFYAYGILVLYNYGNWFTNKLQKIFKKFPHMYVLVKNGEFLYSNDFKAKTMMAYV